MALEQFNKLINLISENFKVASNKKLYNINDSTFKPIKFKDFYICASSLNKDNNHALDRLLNRTNYTFDDLIKLVKAGINIIINNNYLNLFKNNKTEQNFCIISKSKQNIKIAILIAKNTAYSLLETEHVDFYSSKYICFIHTILNKSMEPHDNDIRILTENKNDFIEIIID